VISRRVVNASPLIFLTRVGLLEVLREQGVAVIVPEAVVAEVAAAGEDDPTAAAIRQAGWLEVAPHAPIPAEVQTWDLGPGESAVLAQALARPGSQVVLDDRAARRCAASLAIPTQGTLGLILVAKQVGMIAAVRPVVEDLRRTGMYLSDRTTRQVLELAGEAPTDS
jgi:predicted nucleic acid-binding protein